MINFKARARPAVLNFGRAKALKAIAVPSSSPPTRDFRGGFHHPTPILLQ